MRVFVNFIAPWLVLAILVAFFIAMLLSMQAKNHWGFIASWVTGTSILLGSMSFSKHYGYFGGDARETLISSLQTSVGSFIILGVIALLTSHNMAF